MTTPLELFKANQDLSHFVQAGAMLVSKTPP
jgi:hypothetical protein